MIQRNKNNNNNINKTFHVEEGIQDEHDNQLSLLSKSTDRPKCIYLDYNGTTPVYPQVLRAMMPYLTHEFGNPSSSHAYGHGPRRAVIEARRKIARYILELDDCSDENVRESIVFVGCGSEADNLAIHLALRSNAAGNKRHIVTTNVEHPAVMECLKYLEQDGSDVSVTYVGVNEEGLVSAAEVIAAIQADTCLVTVMLANNETGALMPVKEIAQECRQRGVLFHTDAAQAVGKVNLAVQSSLGGSDMVTIVGHKFGAPKGIAALYIRPGCLEEHGRQLPTLFGQSGALILGGGQEKGRRAGTENVPYIVGIGEAASMISKNDQERMRILRDNILSKIISYGNLKSNQFRINGPKDKNKILPNTLSISFQGISASLLLDSIQQRVAISAGSACHAGEKDKISSILVSMSVPQEFSKGTLRISVGPRTDESEIEKAAELISKEVKRLQNRLY